VDVTNQSVESIAGNGVVLARSQLSSKTVAEDSLAGSLGENSDTQSHPGQLESVSEEIEVSNREDERDDGGIGDTRGAGVVPREQLREEAVVVRQGLAGSGGLGRSLPGSRKVGELGRGLRGLVPNILGNRA
jgi:hypothetical protein